jgi:curved DNA-binding protein CbpA
MEKFEEKGITYRSSQESITKVYRELSIEYHPDKYIVRNKNNGDDEQTKLKKLEEIKDICQAVNLAYTKLSNIVSCELSIDDALHGAKKDIKFPHVPEPILVNLPRNYFTLRGYSKECYDDVGNDSNSGIVRFVENDSLSKIKRVNFGNMEDVETQYKNLAMVLELDWEDANFGFSKQLDFIGTDKILIYHDRIIYNNDVLVKRKKGLFLDGNKPNQRADLYFLIKIEKKRSKISQHTSAQLLDKIKKSLDMSSNLELISDTYKTKLIRAIFKEKEI